MGKKFWSTLFKPKYIASLLILLTLSTGVNAENCVTGNVISKYYTTDRQRGTNNTEIEVSQIPTNIREYITGNSYTTGTKLDIEFAMQIHIRQGNWKGLEYEPLIRVGSTYITNNCTILALENWTGEQMDGTIITYWGICNYTTTADVNYIDISINTGIEQTTNISTKITYEMPCIKKDNENAEIINNDNKNTEKIIQKIQESNADLIRAIGEQTEQIEEYFQTNENAPDTELYTETWEEYYEKEEELENTQAIQNVIINAKSWLEYQQNEDPIPTSFRIMWFVIQHYLFFDLWNMKMVYISIIITFAMLGLILKR